MTSPPPPASAAHLTAVLVDDQGMFLDMLRGALDMYGTVKVVGAARTVDEGIAACRRGCPDLLICDLSLPDGSGLDVVRSALALAPGLIVILLSAQVRTFICPEWLRNNLHAVVDKNRTFQDLRAALDRLKSQVAPKQHPLSAAPDADADADAEAEAEAAEEEAGLSGKPLTQRELQVFRLIGEGFTNRDIAQRIGLAEETIRAHRKRIARKLGTRGNELVKRAIEQRTRMLPPLDR